METSMAKMALHLTHSGTAGMNGIKPVLDPVICVFASFREMGSFLTEMTRAFVRIEIQLSDYDHSF